MDIGSSSAIINVSVSVIKALTISPFISNFSSCSMNCAISELANIREMLDKRYELRDTITLDKFVYSRPAAPDVVDALAERCDFVVTAIAD